MDRRQFLLTASASLLSLKTLPANATNAATADALVSNEPYIAKPCVDESCIENPRNDKPWSLSTPLPINIQEIYPVVHQGRLYVAGGIAAKLGVPYFTAQCYSFDPKSQQWREEAPLPKAMHHGTLVSNGSKLFLFGGFHGGYTHIWRMQDSIYELSDTGWVKIDALPKPLAEGVLSCAPDGAIHWVSGQSPIGEKNHQRSDHQEIHDHYRWDPSTYQWTELRSIPTARNSACGGWLGNQLIITGGRTSKGNLNQTEIYDASNDQWRSAKALPLPQAGSACVMLEDGLIVFGGEIFTPQAKVFKEVWRYYLNEDRWQQLASIPTPRHGLGAGRFGNDIYVIGGATQPSGNGTSNLNERYSL